MPKKKAKPKIMNPKDQKKHMLKRYGTSCNWVDVSLHLTYQEMIDYFGPQCEDFEPLCPSCSNWLSWHKTGKAEIVFERDELIKSLKDMGWNGNIKEKK